MIVLNGFSACFKTSTILYLHDLINGIESDSVLFSELRKRGLMDWTMKPRLISKYITLKNFEKTNTIVDRSLLDLLFFNELMYNDEIDSKAPDCDYIHSQLDNYLDLEKSIDCKHVLIENKWRSSINNIINKPGFNETPRYDVFHNIGEYFMSQDDFIKFYYDKYGKPDIHIVIEDKYDNVADPYHAVISGIAFKIMDLIDKSI